MLETAYNILMIGALIIISICLLSEEEYKNKLLSMQEIVADICGVYPLYREDNLIF